MTGSKEVEEVDILIFTKDRPMQLQLLLETLQRFVTGIGRIVITMQFSTSDYEKGYALLKERLTKDAAFAGLRDKSSISFHERGTLEGSSEALPLLGGSEYILPLSDDSVFYRSYDLVNDGASRYFFEHDDVLNCSIRLGINITPEVHELHKKALFQQAQPEFSVQTDEMLVWSWPDSLNTFSWCNPGSMCNIFRKSDYFGWFRKYKNPVLMEGDIKAQYENAVFKTPGIFVRALRFADRVQQKLLKKLFGVYEQDIIRQFMSKLMFRLPFLVNENIPAFFVSPGKSVVFMPDVNSTLPECIWRNKDHTFSFEELNNKYLSGLKLSTAFIENVIVTFSAPWDISLKEYFQFEKFNAGGTGKA